MYFNPESNSEINNKKKLLISKVGKICSENNIPFLFEPLLYFDDCGTLLKRAFPKSINLFLKWKDSSYIVPESGLTSI